jgi:hypothetical protein
MKKLFSILGAQLLLAVSSYAVTWDVVTVSAVVKIGAGSVTTTKLTARDYLETVSVNSGTPKEDLFVGFREDNGQVAVVRRSDETILFTIVGAPAGGGNASNSSGTRSFISAGANIASPSNVVFAGSIYDQVKRSEGGAIISVNRGFSGGTGNQVIKGTIRTTGRKIVL